MNNKQIDFCRGAETSFVHDVGLNILERCFQVVWVYAHFAVEGRRFDGGQVADRADSMADRADS